MNTRKQVLLMSVLIMVSLMVLAVYAAWYPSRETASAEHFEEQTAERGSILFARNCRTCHGDVGEGGAFGGRLAAAPALDRPDLQGFVDSNATTTADITASATSIPVSNGTRFQSAQTIMINSERMDVNSVSGNNVSVTRGVDHSEASPHSANAKILILDPAVLSDQTRLITNTIVCGRVGTAMPTWGQEHNGPLSDEQVRQLMTVITKARWDLVKEEVDIEDAIPSSLVEEMSEDTISAEVSDVGQFTANEVIRIGDERMRVTAVPLKPDANARDKSGIIQVQRGILGTTPLAHGPEEELFRFPEGPSEPSITQSACGQTARAPTESTPPATIEPFDGQNSPVVARGVAFNVSTITLRTGGQVRVRLDNQDDGVQHNIAFYQSSTNLTPVSPGSVGTTFPGVNVDDTVFAVPAAGSYFFRCDVHPTTMTGTLTVN